MAVVLFDATAGECKWNVRDSSATGAVTACAIDVACSRIFSAATDCSLVARALDDGSAQLSFKVGKHHAACIAVSPDGSQLVAAGAFIKLFSVASQVLQPPKPEPLSLTLSPRRPCCADTPPQPPLSPTHRSALAVRSRLSS